MTIIKKSLLATTISAIALSSAVTVQAEGFDSVIKDSTLDFNFRLRVESADVEGAPDAALATTLKSRATFKSGAVSGFSVLVEADNVVHLTDDFNDTTPDGDTSYDKVPDPETTQFNQAYIQYTGFDSTIKAGNQRIVLDNQRHVGGVAWRQDEATFDAVSITNKSIDNTTIFAAVANNRNTIKNVNTKEDITLLNVKYAVNEELAITGFYYGIETEAGAERDTFGVRAVGSVSDFGYEAEVATQDTDDNSTLYYHLAGSTKIASVKATLGYEAFGSDDGAAAFKTPLGTNHKFFGWSDTYLTGARDSGIQDIYVSAVTKVSGVKLVGQFHKFDSVEGSTDLGTELGFVAAKNFNNFGVALKLAQFNAGDGGFDDATKIWLTGSAKF
jgi:hypothetical protein